MASKQKMNVLREKIERTRTVITNLKSFKDWSYDAYKVREGEKDIIIEGMSNYLSDLEDVLDKLEGESDDDTELCQ